VSNEYKNTNGGSNENKKKNGNNEKKNNIENSVWPKKHVSKYELPAGRERSEDFLDAHHQIALLRLIAPTKRILRIGMRVSGAVCSVRVQRQLVVSPAIHVAVALPDPVAPLQSAMVVPPPLAARAHRGWIAVATPGELARREASKARAALAVGVDLRGAAGPALAGRYCSERASGEIHVAVCLLAAGAVLQGDVGVDAVHAAQVVPDGIAVPVVLASQHVLGPWHVAPGLGEPRPRSGTADAAAPDGHASTVLGQLDVPLLAGLKVLVRPRGGGSTAIVSTLNPEANIVVIPSASGCL
jgi:hypothetical protein